MSKYLVLIFLIFGGSCLCWAQNAGNWGSEPPGSDRWQRYRNFRSCNVSPKYVDSCFNLLQKRDLIALSPQEADRLADRKLKRSSRMKIFLIRTIWSAYNTGVYIAGRKKDDLWVIHSSYGGGTHPKKNPLIVFVGFTPKKLFTSMEIAE